MKIRHKSRKKRVSRRAKRGTHFSSKGGTFVYRSSWELAYATWLDVNEDVVSYRYEPFAVEYVSNYRTGKIRKYYPDFEVTRIDGTRLLIEIKPMKKLTVAKNVKKFAAAVSFCHKQGITFHVYTEVDLKALGLLK